MHKHRCLLHHGHNAPARAERCPPPGAPHRLAPPHRQVLIELAEPQKLCVLYIAIACGRDEHPEFNVPGDERYRIRGVSLRRHQLPKIDDGQDSCTLQGGAASVDDAREN